MLLCVSCISLRIRRVSLHKIKIKINEMAIEMHGTNAVMGGYTSHRPKRGPSQYVMMQ